MRTITAIFLTLGLASYVKAQDTTHVGKLTISSYVELYDMPLPNAVIRLEGKTYHSKDAIFVNGRSFSANSPLITARIGVSF
jgi:hypothetical protein